MYRLAVMLVTVALDLVGSRKAIIPLTVVESACKGTQVSFWGGQTLPSAQIHPDRFWTQVNGGELWFATYSPISLNGVHEHEALVRVEDHGADEVV